MRIRVSVKPGSSTEAVSRQPDGSLLVRVHERAHDGEANAAVIKAVAGFLGLPKSRVLIVSGQRGRSKLLEVPD
jgi:uncharacterized protein